MKQTEDNTQDQEDLRLLRESAQTLFARAGGSDRARGFGSIGGRLLVLVRRTTLRR